MDNFQGAPRRPAWIRGAFAASLVAAGALALSPDWASALKAQGYYGSVDLGVTLTPSQTPRAGEAVDFLVTVRNDGPDAANRVRTIAGAQNLHVLETNGCAADPLGYPQCALPSPLAAGANGDYLLRMAVPSAARGNVVLSVGATSDDDEIAPGDEVALFKAPIAVTVNGRTSAACDESAAVQNGRLHCVFEFVNDGPSDATVMHLAASAPYAVAAAWNCVASRPVLCASMPSPGNSVDLFVQGFAAGDWLRLTGTIDIGEIHPALSHYFVYSSVYSNDPDDVIADNHASVEFPIVLFRDDFEPISPSSNP